MAKQEQAEASPAEIEEHLSGVDYPASKQDLKRHAQNQNAPSDVVDVIDRMPDQEYGSAADVAKGVGKAE